MAFGQEHAENFHLIFRAFVGQGCTFTCESAAGFTGITPRTVRSHHDGVTAPSYAHLLKYMKVLGPDFAGALLAPLDFKVLYLGECAAPNHQMSQLSQVLADFLQAAEDGEIDHRERLDMAPGLRDLGNGLLAFAAKCETEKGPMRVVEK